MKNITVSKARIHNLKNIDVRIPKDKIVVVTGVIRSTPFILRSHFIFVVYSSSVYVAGTRHTIPYWDMLCSMHHAPHQDKLYT